MIKCTRQLLAIIDITERKKLKNELYMDIFNFTFTMHYYIHKY